MMEEIQKGRQCYVICPMVEEQEDSDLISVESYTEKLQSEFPDSITIEGLHGKMKAVVKNHIMNEFAQNRIQILVSTTVVEVGVNVPNATIMVIENAERFGLAQLHQLRGRVGRGIHESHCVLISDSKTTTTRDRLSKLKDTTDGFVIADYDLKTRGPGDSFGTKQHGLPNFRLGNIYEDMDILKETLHVAKSIIEIDPTLEKPIHQGIRERIKLFYKDCSDIMIL
jgi:ATP-dependent DNA helicase RecG